LQHRVVGNSVGLRRLRRRKWRAEIT
jgi:hypothetical protein